MQQSKIYCLMDGYRWGLYSEYQIILHREWKQTNLDFKLNWEQSKNGIGDDTEWWSGFNNIRKKCHSPKTCDFVYYMRTVQSPNTIGNLYFTVFLNNWYINDESNKFSFIYEDLVQGQIMGRSAELNMKLHMNKSWSSTDLDNSIHGGCIKAYKACFWHVECFTFNPFLDFGLNPPYTITYMYADSSQNGQEKYDTLDIVGFGVRNHNDNGDGINAKNGIGSVEIDQIILQCDHSICATCSGTRTNCIKFCNQNCRICNPVGKCTSCIEGTFLQTGNCIKCNISVCATCIDTNNNCILKCNKTCKTCLVDQSCDSCIEGMWLNVGMCEFCNNNKCATCDISKDSCILSCNIDCLTCDIDATCLTCNIGYFLINGQCIDCSNKKCIQCLSNDLKCIDSCNSNCTSCILNQEFYQDNLTCIKCKYPCQQCINEILCISCYNQLNRVNNQSCECSPGYYDNDSICLKCPQKCNTCIDNITCSGQICSDLLRDYSLNCECKQGYYDESRKCLKCSYKCQTCIFIKENCIDCVKAENRSQIPPCNCLQGYVNHKDEDNPTCVDPSNCGFQLFPL